MEEGGENGAGSKRAAPDGNPNPAPAALPSADAAAVPPPPSTRTPFTSLSQVDADYALARVLQDQERAYARLTSNGFYYDSSDEGSYDYEDEEDEEDEEEEEESEWDELEYADRADDGNAREENASGAAEPNTHRAEFENLAFASALEGAEEQAPPVQFAYLTGLQIRSPVDAEDDDSNSEDSWQESDQDEYSYEELIALGEVVGTESRGLPTDVIAALPTVNYKAENAHTDNVEQCVICRLEYQDGDSLVLLSCKHKYHFECINEWLQINKVCPVCTAEVSTSK